MNTNTRSVTPAHASVSPTRCREPEQETGREGARARMKTAGERENEAGERKRKVAEARRGEEAGMRVGVW